MNATAKKYAYKSYNSRKPRLKSVGKHRLNSDFLRLDSVSVNYSKVYYENLVWKRALDIVFGIMGLVICAILYPFIALGIKLSSNGKVIFEQERSGFDGGVFNCYKFRTMHNKENNGANGTPDITKENDNRIFKFGEFLRKTNLDELPQFINILRGDMSVVGPRPYTLRENSYWNATFPDFYKRFAVKPGLTGLAQASGFRGGTLNLKHMKERLKRDLLYVGNRSLSMDLKLILITLKKMFFMNTDAH